MKVKSEREVAQLCPTLTRPMASIHGIFQARVLEWGAIAFSVRRELGMHKPFKDRMSWGGVNVMSKRYDSD